MKKVLIVEDDPITARIYSSQLSKAGFEVKVATDGRKGLEELVAFNPDGLLVDYMMPNLNGLDLVRAVRSTAGCESIPLFIFSNAAVPAVIEEAKKAGASQVFDKSMASPAQIVNAFQVAIG